MKSILDKLKIKRYVDYFKLTNDFGYDLYNLLSTLVYARSVHPCSKHKTFHEVLPNLFHPYDYSYDHLLDGVSFLGRNYEKFVELFTAQVQSVYGVDTSKTYFDGYLFSKSVKGLPGKEKAWVLLDQGFSECKACFVSFQILRR